MTWGRRKDTEEQTFSSLIWLVIKTSLMQILINSLSVFLAICGRKRFIGAFEEFWISFPKSLAVHPFTLYL